MQRPTGTLMGPAKIQRQIRGPRAFSLWRSSQAPPSAVRGTEDGDAGGEAVEQLRRILLVGIADPGLRARGFRVEEVTIAQLRAEVAASPGGVVAVVGRTVLDAGPVRDLSDALRRPKCVLFACPDGADCVTIARWARESEFEFFDGAMLAGRVAAAAPEPVREAVPVVRWAPAKARESSDLAPALEILARCHPLTAGTWAGALRLSRHQLYRLCKRTSGRSADRLTWLCLRATVAHLEATGHDPAGVHILVGYSSDRALRRALERKWR